MKSGLVLALAGFCLILLQFFMIRKVTALLRGTELVVLLVTVAYFAGYSVGYGVAGWLTLSRIRWLALATWVAHLTIPFSFRYVGGYLYSLKPSGVELAGLMFLTAFALSTFYSVLLPRFIDETKSLVKCYAVELLGAVAGVLVLLGVGRWPVVPLVLYQIALAGIVALLWRRALVWILAGIGVLAYAFAYSTFEQDSLNYSYAKIQKFENHQVVYSVNTLYQKVDIVREADDTRYIYLSGRQNYGSSHLQQFNRGLALLPASVLKPKEVLIVGSGSMASVRFAAMFAEHVTTCEIDPAVIVGSRRWFADVHHLDEIKNWSLVIDDAKQFLGTTGKKFDLIVMDVPAPSTIQVGLLHSVDFYRLAKTRLAPGGMISVSLCGTFGTENPTPRTIAAALARVFPAVLVYTPVGAERSFALAGEAIPFADERFEGAALAAGFDGVELHRGAEVGAAEPLTADDMRVVLVESWKHFQYLLPEAMR